MQPLNSNSNSCICSAPPTISPMAHSIVSGSGRSVLSWTEMSLDDAWMLLSTTAWVSVRSATDFTHGVQRQRTHGLRIAAPSVEERGCRCWRRAATSVLVCRRPAGNLLYNVIAYTALLCQCENIIYTTNYWSTYKFWQRSWATLTQRPRKVYGQHYWLVLCFGYSLTGRRQKYTYVCPVRSRGKRNANGLNSDQDQHHSTANNGKSVRYNLIPCR